MPQVIQLSRSISSLNLYSHGEKIFQFLNKKWTILNFLPSISLLGLGAASILAYNINRSFFEEKYIAWIKKTSPSNFWKNFPFKVVEIVCLSMIPPKIGLTCAIFSGFLPISRKNFEYHVEPKSLENKSSEDGDCALLKKIIDGDILFPKSLSSAKSLINRLCYFDLNRIHPEWGNKTFLERAIEKHLTAIVKMLLEAGAKNITVQPNSNSFGALKIAVQIGDAHSTKLLFTHAKDIKSFLDSNYRYEINPLKIAFENDHAEIMRCLVNQGVELNDFLKGNLEGLLLNAFHFGKIKVVQWLLKKRISVNIQSSNGMTPLHYAAANGWEDIMALLLKKEANPEACTKEDYLIQYYNLSFLVPAGSNYKIFCGIKIYQDIKKIHTNASLLQFILDIDAPEVLSPLLDQFSNIKIIFHNHTHETLLQEAIKNECIKLIDYLIVHSKKFNKPISLKQVPNISTIFSNNTYEYLLDQAILNKCIHIIDYIVDHSKEFNKPFSKFFLDEYLFKFAYSGNPLILSFFNKSNLLDIIDSNYGMTLLHAAAFCGNPEAITFLLEKGVCPDIVTTKDFVLERKGKIVLFIESGSTYKKYEKIFNDQIAKEILLIRMGINFNGPIKTDFFDSKNNFELADLLLDYNEFKQGKIWLDLAFRRACFAISLPWSLTSRPKGLEAINFVHYLLKKGADPTLFFNSSPFHQLDLLFELEKMKDPKDMELEEDLNKIKDLMFNKWLLKYFLINELCSSKIHSDLFPHVFESWMNVIGLKLIKRPTSPSL